MISILSGNQIEDLRKSGEILSFALKKASEAVAPGIKTRRLDEIAESEIRKAGAIPAFKNYTIDVGNPYPASLCVSINHQVVHGIPGEYVLQEGDIVSLDLGAGYNGIYTDMAVTLPVGNISIEAKRLIQITKECLEVGISWAKTGNRIGAIGEAIQKHAENNGFSVVRDLVGHGVGLKPHMEPKVPNFGNKNEGEEIIEGLTIAIEPMITAGKHAVKMERDNWTISTKDYSLAAHFEHTIIIKNGKAEIVTKS